MVTVSVTDGSGQVRSTSVIQAIYLPTTAKPPAASSNLLLRTRPARSLALWVVNQDNDSVTVFDAVTLAKQAEIGVGSEPRALALAPNGLIWVTKQAQRLDQRHRSGHEHGGRHDRAAARVAPVRDRDVPDLGARLRRSGSDRSRC